jgi:hypothetical protein
MGQKYKKSTLLTTNTFFFAQYEVQLILSQGLSDSHKKSLLKQKIYQK